MNTRMLSRITRAEAAVAARTPPPGQSERERGRNYARLLLRCPAAISLVGEICMAYGLHHQDPGGREAWLRTDPWAVERLAEADRLTMSVPNRAAILAGEAYE